MLAAFAVAVVSRYSTAERVMMSVKRWRHSWQRSLNRLALLMLLACLTTIFHSPLETKELYGLSPAERFATFLCCSVKVF